MVIISLRRHVFEYDEPTKKNMTFFRVCKRFIVLVISITRFDFQYLSIEDSADWCECIAEYALSCHIEESYIFFIKRHNSLIFSLF